MLSHFMSPANTFLSILVTFLNYVHLHGVIVDSATLTFYSAWTDGIN